MDTGSQLDLFTFKDNYGMEADSYVKGNSFRCQISDDKCRLFLFFLFFFFFFFFFFLTNWCLERSLYVKLKD